MYTKFVYIYAINSAGYSTVWRVKIINFYEKSKLEIKYQQTSAVSFYVLLISSMAHPLRFPAY